jgi:hypothetical protein
MDTSVLLNQVDLDIRRNLRQLISQKYGRMFYPYVLLSATADIKNIYMTAFRTYLRDFSPRLSEKIHFAAINLVYMLQMFLDINKTATFSQVLDAAYNFLTLQMEDYYTWSADLSQQI